MLPRCLAFSVQVSLQWICYVIYVIKYILSHLTRNVGEQSLGLIYWNDGNWMHPSVPLAEIRSSNVKLVEFLPLEWICGHRYFVKIIGYIVALVGLDRHCYMPDTMSLCHMHTKAPSKPVLQHLSFGWVARIFRLLYVYLL